MKRTHRLLVIAACASVAAALAAAGCWIDADPWHPTGATTFRWSIAGRKAAAECTLCEADRVRLHVIDTSGHVHPFPAPRCDAFEDGVVIDTGRYHAELTLLDAHGAPVSATVVTDTFNVVQGYTTMVPLVDFPTCWPTPIGAL